MFHPVVQVWIPIPASVNAEVRKTNKNEGKLTSHTRCLESARSLGGFLILFLLVLHLLYAYCVVTASGLVSNLWCGVRCESSGGLIMISAFFPQITVGDKRYGGKRNEGGLLCATAGMRITFVRGLVGLVR